MGGSVISITGSAGLIKRVYYPREIFPLTVVVSNAVNMFLSLVILLPFFLLYEIPFSWNLFLLPIPIIFLFFFTLGFCLIISCANVFFRDMSYVVPFVIRLWFYLTPVFYVIEGRIPEKYVSVYMLSNPLAAILGFFRACMLNFAFPSFGYTAISFGSCLFVLMVGYAFFKKFEDLMVKRI